MPPGKGDVRVFERFPHLFRALAAVSGQWQFCLDIFRFLFHLFFLLRTRRYPASAHLVCAAPPSLFPPRAHPEGICGVLRRRSRGARNVAEGGDEKQRVVRRGTARTSEQGIFGWCCMGGTWAIVYLPASFGCAKATKRTDPMPVRIISVRHGAGEAYALCAGATKMQGKTTEKSEKRGLSPRFRH